MAKDGQRDAILLHNGVLALVLGYPLAIALSSLAHRSMLALGAGPVTGQLTMWIVYPLWLAAICLVFLLPSRRAGWAWLAAANAIAAGACFALLPAGGGGA